MRKKAQAKLLGREVREDSMKCGATFTVCFPPFRFRS
jgi:hypothetical protein